MQGKLGGNAWEKSDRELIDDRKKCLERSVLLDVARGVAWRSFSVFKLQIDFRFLI